MKSENKKIGAKGEDAAAEYILRNGYKILKRNFRCRSGEIDIIAFECGYIVFIEVKTRTQNYYGSPGEAVNRSKIAKIHRTAQVYMLKSRLFYINKIRFDVIEVFYNKDKGSISINLIKNAF